MSDMIESLINDEAESLSLASYRKTKNGSKVKELDHNSLITKVKSNWVRKQHNDRMEMYNLKDQEGLVNFKNMTS